MCVCVCSVDQHVCVCMLCVCVYEFVGVFVHVHDYICPVIASSHGMSVSKSCSLWKIISVRASMEMCAFTGKDKDSAPVSDRS